MSICLMTRFKNEKHIMYEFIHHYLAEGVDFFLLIDDGSTDNYFELNKDWMEDLIKSKKIIIKQGKLDQITEYNLHLQEIKKYKWLIVSDMDEFFFSIPKNTTLKSILSSQLSTFDYYNIPWKLFTHNCYNQPKSVINTNLYTHESLIDPTSSSKGYKYIIKTSVIKRLKIHQCITKQNSKNICIKNAHNKLIQINHYRTQSEEYLRGIKEIRGGGVNKNKYKDFKNHKKNIYNKKCNLLLNKNKNLINCILERVQIKPKIYNNSSFYLENSNNLK